MFDALILGIIQGIVEWLPVSSEGVLVLLQTHFFGGGGLAETVGVALFLHLGTFFAALSYFRKDVAELLKVLAPAQWRRSDAQTRNIFWFLVVATLISGGIGAVLLTIAVVAEAHLAQAGVIVTAGIGALLLGTGALQLYARERAERRAGEASRADGVLLGLVQAAAALPGFSRSGLTTSALLLRGYKAADALRLSFLMSLPIVLGGNIVLNLSGFAVSGELLLGLAAAFVFGLATIHVLLRIAEHINFAYFVIIFGLITIGSVFI